MGGIACPGTCAANLTSGAVVTLTATPAPGASFKTWRGACTGPALACALIMDAAKTVTAVFAKTFTDDPLFPQETPINAVHFTELRDAINTLRAVNGQPAFGWSTSGIPGGPVLKAHLTDLRTALTAAYVAASKPTPTYTDPVITVRQTIIKASHLSELRSHVRGLE